MVDKYTYELLKRLHEFPWGKDGDELEYGSFEAKYHAIYGHGNELGNLYSKLKSLGYLDIPRNEMSVQILFTKKSFDAVREYENALVQNNWKAQMEDENLKLQNEKFKYEETIRDRNDKISKLDLILKKWQLFGYKWWISGIIFSILTFLLSHLKEVRIILSQLWKLVSKQ